MTTALRKIGLVLMASFVTFGAQAQEIGLLAGIHNTDVKENGLAAADAELGYRLGVNAAFELTREWWLRTGALYVDRKFSIENNAAVTDAKLKFAYIDIPVLFQYQMNEMLALYAGPVVGINVGKKMDGTVAGVAVSGDVSDTKSLYLLGQAGVNLKFDAIAFDLYYERGFGEISDNGYENFSIIGMNLIFWL